MSNGRLAIPNQINIDVQLHNGPPVHPTTVQLPASGGVTQHVFGGITKLEQGALQIAAALCGMIPPPDGAYDDGSQRQAYLDAVPGQAVAIAARVLAECERVQQPAKVQA